MHLAGQESYTLLFSPVEVCICCHRALHMVVCTYGSLYNIQGWLNRLVELVSQRWWNRSGKSGSCWTIFILNQAHAIYTHYKMYTIHTVSLCQIGSYPPAAFDLKIIHPLNSANILDASLISGSTAEKGEKGRMIMPVIYGGWGHEAITTFARLSKLLSLDSRQP